MEMDCVSMKEFNEKIKLVEKWCNSLVDSKYIDSKGYYADYFNYIYNNLSSKEIGSCIRNKYHEYDIDDWIMLKKIFTNELSYGDAMKITRMLYKYDTSLSEGHFEYDNSEFDSVYEEAEEAWGRKKNEK